MRRSFILWALIALVLLSLPRPAAAQTPAPDQEAKVSAALQARLQQADSPVSVLVVMADQLDLPTALAGQPPSTARVAAAYTALTAHAVATQADLRAWLDARGVAYRPYYIANMLQVPADGDLVAEIAQRDDVAAIVDNPRIYQTHARAVPALFDGWQARFGVAGGLATVQPDLLPYGLAATHAVDVWAMGYTGQGVVLASQDTGVEWTHPALQFQYRGWNARTATADHVYNWFDAWDTAGRPTRCVDDAQTPCDDDGHGTHTVGTMLGNATASHDQVGMAPSATWIGCRNMVQGFGTPAAYAACFEFFLAPYPQDGDPFTQGRPELAPHIINNSWGCPPSEGCDADTLQTVVENVRTAGIFVVSSAGNNGFLGCNTVVDPIAIYDASLSVGAHAASGDIANFSSRGPVTVDASDREKPDLTAPGVAVESTMVNDSYAVLQGTSMASPHVAGAIALLWSAAPNLLRDIDTSEQIILKSATPVPVSLCTGDDPVSPNNVFGYGRLDALAAVTMARHPMHLTLTLTRDGATTPIPGATTVTLVDQRTGFAHTATAATAGEAVFDPVYAGEYAVRIVAGDTDVTLGGIELGMDEPEQSGELRGDGVTVTYAAVATTPGDGRVYFPLLHTRP